MSDEAEVIDAPVDASPTTTAVVEYNATEAGLVALRARLTGVAYDLSTGKGMDIAKADRAELRTLRTTLESRRKDLKAGILERGRLLDGEAKRITAEIEALETPIDEQIKAAEKHKEEERKAKEVAERKRVTEIHARIAEITAYVVLAGECRTAAKVQALVDKVAAIEIDKAVFQEFEFEAADAKAKGLERMGQIFEAKDGEEKERARVKAEQDAERIKLDAERAELEQLRAAQAAAQAKAEAEARAVRDAEEKRLADQRAQLEAEKTKFRQAQEQARQNTQEALAKFVVEDEPDDRSPVVIENSAMFERFEPAVYVAPSMPEAIAQVIARPSNREIINAVADRFDVDSVTAIEWIKAIDFTTL